MDDFVECLFGSKLRSGDRTSLYVLESECVLLLVMRTFYDHADKLLDEWDEPYQDTCVDGVEEGMEH